MKLSQIEAEVKSTVGVEGPFMVKSLKSGRVFRVTGKTPSGLKYVIVNVADTTKEYLVNGTEERYVLHDDGTLAMLKRKTEIHTLLDKLQTQALDLDNQMTRLEEELMSITEEVG